MPDQANNSFVEIQAGQTVKNFLTAINGNFAQTKKITISQEAPSGGNDGDIWIQY
jgi:hypothetical protein